MAIRFVVLGFALFGVLLACPCRSQTGIPIGAWRLHLSYNNIRSVEAAPAKIFAASESGILVVDRQDKSLSTYTKLNGLSGTGIASIRFDEAKGILLAGYEDGNLDLLRENTILNFDRLRNAEVASPKKINDIRTRDDFAYLATAYGVVLFDLNQLEIRETWRDLGTSGEELPVYQTAFLNDSVYLATRNGILAGKMTDNLLDYNVWKRFNTGNFSGPISSIASFNNKVYAAGPSGLYHLGDGTWVQDPVLQAASIQSLSASGKNLLMISDSTIWAMNASGELSEISDRLITAPDAVTQDEDGNYWVGDQAAGLISDAGGSFSSYVPNGPSMSAASKMVFNEGKLFVLAGGFSAAGEPLNIPGDLNVYENGNWSALRQPFSDLTDIAFDNDRTYLSTFGSGIAKTDLSGDTTLLDATNSPLTASDPQKSNITAMQSSADGLWIANYGGSEPLHLLKSDGAWESHSFGYPNEQTPTALSVDANGDVWMALNPGSGGGVVVYDRQADRSYYLTNAAGAGGLPDMNARSLATDNDGYTWVGTDAGVAYFYSPAKDAIKPIYENRFLLRDEKITAIEVDGGNRKWIGTEEGVWLFSPTGETLVQHFTPENSPLLSGIIRDIEIDDETGEVFFATDRGIVSYRGNAVAGLQKFSKLKIFPNPVHPGFSGTVGITGLSTNAFVRITDVSGKLIWQTQANGGMATWNVRDQDGRHAATGIYLVFASDQDGSESVVGKIAVIE